jgi:uncharacterized protein DUF2637
MKRDPFVLAGLTIVTLAAAVSSFGALRGTALFAGWSRDMSPLLPIVVDTVAATASRLWLSGDTPEKVRRFARSVALGAIFVSVGGNMIYHLAEAGYLRPGVWLTLAAGGIPPIALATVAHLTALQRAVPAEVPVPAAEMISTAPEVPEPTRSPEAPAIEPEEPVQALPEPIRVPLTRHHQRVTPPRQTAIPGGRTEEQLLDAARAVNAASIAESGRPAGVSKLRVELRVGQARAQELRDYLRALPEPVEHANGHNLVGAAG